MPSTIATISGPRATHLTANTFAGARPGEWCPNMARARAGQPWWVLAMRGEGGPRLGECWPSLVTAGLAWRGLAKPGETWRGMAGLGESWRATRLTKLGVGWARPGEGWPSLARAGLAWGWQAVPGESPRTTFQEVDIVRGYPTMGEHPPVQLFKRRKLYGDTPPWATTPSYKDSRGKTCT